MKSTQTLRLFLALALGSVAAGCTDQPADAGDDHGGGDVGGVIGDQEARPTDATGTYELQSKFDLATNAPGKAGEVVNLIIAMTDDPDDPTLWVLDQAISAMPSGVLKTALQSAKPYVAGFLNDRVLDLAPDFVSTAVQLAGDFGQMAKGFGLNERLEVTGAPGAYTSKLTVVGAHFKIDNVESDHAFADHGTPDVVADTVGLTLDDKGKLGIGEHQIAVSYGKILRMGVDAAIVPMLEPSAHNLGELLASKVNCALIGQLIASAVGLGGSSTYASACTAGLNKGAEYIYSKIASIDGTALAFGLAGTAKALDKDRDGRVDSLVTGAWAGNVSYGSTPAPLAGATFFGARK
ncbi:MAG TPA: hypothetical protein VN253_22065 [Kofleriaceae bacterium]|nr:hypothetical protein [Kofleriaceae bacterium]